uniref:C-type mannose receptor 2 n=1 Tax=Magallana gigas TaxID=29159 RepID=K1Q369_MAGGI
MKSQVVILLSVLSAVLARCPADWDHYNDKCFFLSRDNETFAGALKLCEVIGAQYGRVASLATVDDAGTQSHLEGLVTKTSSLEYYIGATDIVHEGTWVWVSNGQTATYTNWGPFQPNNRGGAENCAGITYDLPNGFVGHWTDKPCTKELPYICEMPGYRKYFAKTDIRGNLAYCFENKLCEVIGAQYGRVASLATVDDAGTQSHLEGLVTKTSSLEYYIGATDIVHEGTWVWVSNGQTATYTNWGPFQPNNRGGAENCAGITYDQPNGFVGHWTDKPCTKELPYICEMPPSDKCNASGEKTCALARCPADWDHYNDRCFFLSRDNETFADALSLCEVIGKQYGRVATLATVDDAGTQKHLANLVSHTSSLGFYIGANDLVHEGTWVWVSSGHAITYNNWGPTQPNNRDGAEHCAVITYAPQDGFVYHWTDEPCTNQLTYICEMPFDNVNAPVVG